jgi:hypothetical protein
MWFAELSRAYMTTVYAKNAPFPPVPQRRPRSSFRQSVLCVIRILRASGDMLSDGR